MKFITIIEDAAVKEMRDYSSIIMQYITDRILHSIFGEVSFEINGSPCWQWSREIKNLDETVRGVFTIIVRSVKPLKDEYEIMIGYAERS